MTYRVFIVGGVAGLSCSHLRRQNFSETFGIALNIVYTIVMTTAQTSRRVSKYTNDPALLHQVDLICAQQATKEEAAAALGYKSVAVLNTILNRTGLNLRVKGVGRNTDHLFKSTLTNEQHEALNAAVARAMGLRKGGAITKVKVWEQDAKDLISYVRFCALVKKAEEVAEAPAA